MDRTNKPIILVVDDDAALCDLLSQYLEKQGFTVDSVEEGKAMDLYLENTSPDLIILDLMLPGEDGLSIAKRLNSHGQIPLIMLSACGEEVDRIIGLEVGADDYLAKPFSPRELLARIRSVLRRYDRAESVEAKNIKSVFHFGPYLLDTMSQTLKRGDEDIAVTSGDISLLKIFLNNPNKVLNRDTLLEKLKGYDCSPYDRSIDVRIMRLRQKIELDTSSPQFIQTVWGGRLSLCGNWLRGMNWLKHLNSLSVKTSVTLGFGLLIYTAISIALVLYFVLIPMSDRAADDMAAFIGMASESWVAMNEIERQAFETHLRDEHQLFISSAPVPVVAIKKYYPFIPRLENALMLHTGQPVTIKQNSAGRCCFWLEILQNKQLVRIGFYHDRIGPKPPIALAGILASACILILVTTILLVRRITSPVRKLSIAANQFGKGDFSIRIPETGPQELASLAHSFNLMAEQLAQLMSNRTILFGGISHDLRTPITRMQIALELLDDSGDSKLLAGLRNDLNEMERLIQQALELVKGLDKNNPVETDMGQIITKIVADYQRQQLLINWQQCSCGVFKIEVDALHRVLANLLDNAFRYGEDQPVDLYCLKKGKNIIIRIIDQGPGIPKEQLARVFQPFFRLDSSRSKKTGGSGLGLAIVRQLCDVHGWKIQLLAAKVKGLEACLIIPVEQ